VNPFGMCKEIMKHIEHSGEDGAYSYNDHGCVK